MGGLTEPKISDVKGSVFEEAFEAARCELVGLGGGRTWRNGRGLWSCRSVAMWGQRGPHHSGDDGSHGRRSSHDGNYRYTADLPTDAPIPGKCAGFLGKSEEGVKSQSVG